MIESDNKMSKESAVRPCQCCFPHGPSPFTDTGIPDAPQIYRRPMMPCILLRPDAPFPGSGSISDPMMGTDHRAWLGKVRNLYLHEEAPDARDNP